MRGSRGIVGILLGLASGLAFGAGGAVVKPLLEAGWSPGAAVFLRVSVAALLLVVPGLIALRFDLRPLWRAKWTVLIYSVIAVAGVQLAFYASIARIPVSTALLIEYLAPVALVAFAWVRTPPSPADRRARRIGRRDRGARARHRPGRRCDRPDRHHPRRHRHARRRGLLRARRARRPRCSADRAGSGRLPHRSARARPRRSHRARALRVRAHRHALPRHDRPVVGARAHGRRRLDGIRLRGGHPGDPHARHQARLVPRPLRGRLRRHRRVDPARRGDRPRAAARRRAHPRRHRARAPRAARRSAGAASRSTSFPVRHRPGADRRSRAARRRRRARRRRTRPSASRDRRT